MSKAISIEIVDNGYICKKIVSEGEQAKLADVKVFEKSEDLIKWMETNLK